MAPSGTVALKSYQSFVVSDGLLMKTVEAVKAGEKEARSSGEIQSFEILSRGQRYNICVGKLMIIPPAIADSLEDFPVALLYGCLVREFGGEEMAELISQKIGDNEFDEYSKADMAAIKDKLFKNPETNKMDTLVLFAPSWSNKREYVAFRFTKDDKVLGDRLRHLVFASYYNPAVSSAFNALMTSVDTDKFDVTDITPKLTEPALTASLLVEYPLLEKSAGQRAKQKVFLTAKTADAISKQQVEPRELNVFEALETALKNSEFPKTVSVSEAGKAEIHTAGDQAAAYQHDAEIVVSQVLNGGFMQLWDNYEGRHNDSSVRSMIARTAKFFEDKGAPEIAKIFAAATKINGKLNAARDRYGNVDEEALEAASERLTKQWDPLEDAFYGMWEFNGVEGSWEKYFGADAENIDSPLFRSMQQQPTASKAACYPVVEGTNVGNQDAPDNSGIPGNEDVGQDGSKAPIGIELNSDGTPIQKSVGKEKKAELSVPDRHMLRIAIDTLKAPDAMVGVMGGPSKEEALKTLARFGYRWDDADYMKGGKGVKRAASKTAETITLGTPTQVALYKGELCGQMSDGMWENSSPMNHWREMCNADVKVGQPGMDFWPRRTYGFNQLIPIIGDRMLALAKTSIAYPNADLSAHTVEYVLENANKLADIKDTYVQKYITEILAATGEPDINTFIAKVNAVPYDMADLRKDLWAIMKVVNGKYKGLNSQYDAVRHAALDKVASDEDFLTFEDQLPKHASYENAISERRKAKGKTQESKLSTAGGEFRRKMLAQMGEEEPMRGFKTASRKVGQEDGFDNDSVLNEVLTDIGPAPLVDVPGQENAAGSGPAPSTTPEAQNVPAAMESDKPEETKAVDDSATTSQENALDNSATKEQVETNTEENPEAEKTADSFVPDANEARAELDFNMNDLADHTLDQDERINPDHFAAGRQSPAMTDDMGDLDPVGMFDLRTEHPSAAPSAKKPTMDEQERRMSSQDVPKSAKGKPFGGKQAPPFGSEKKDEKKEEKEAADNRETCVHCGQKFHDNEEHVCPKNPKDKGKAGSVSRPQDRKDDVPESQGEIPTSDKKQPVSELGKGDPAPIAPDVPAQANTHVAEDKKAATPEEELKEVEAAVIQIMGILQNTLIDDESGSTPAAFGPLGEQLDDLHTKCEQILNGIRMKKFGTKRLASLKVAVASLKKVALSLGGPSSTGGGDSSSGGGGIPMAPNPGGSAMTPATDAMGGSFGIDVLGALAEEIVRKEK